MNKTYKPKKCSHCCKPIERIWFAANMIEEWLWNGHNWECAARNTLTEDSHMPVRCANCGSIIVDGVYFGFDKNMQDKND